ncbi:cytosolic 5'-nucleotidase 1A isoform X2 [Megalops cyprinoides]|uniref:cytosolic 5'-nucleotidase 1A isoform X2 n=1 Tax=Megalops cyprinoides TaxID=118141 RepID=UPI001864027B|nr:cytosolic 5'-nucleotidase 1A isoform X2 [Megalops cyprinoides]
MNANIVLNPGVKQKDPSRALVIAVSSHAMFELGGELKLHLQKVKQEPEPKSTVKDNEPFREGIAFPFIKAVQQVNKKLLEKNANEMLLFDVILFSNDVSPASQSRVVNSALHYDTDEVGKALKEGFPAALLYQQRGQGTTDTLRVLFSGDVLGFSDDMAHFLREQGFSEPQLQSISTAKGAMKEFATVIGEMRRRFGREGSPLCTCLVTVWTPRDACAGALKMLRGWGLEVDEAFCLAGAPQSPILAQIQPHILYDHGLHNARNVPAQC